MTAPIDAYASFIRAQPWDWWAHLTFRHDVGSARADAMFRAWTNLISRQAFGRRYWNRDQRLRWIRCTEWQQGGRLHYHALVYGCRGHAAAPTLRLHNAHPHNAQSVRQPVSQSAQITSADPMPIGRTVSQDYGQSAWQQLAGDAEIALYLPEKDAADYLVKGVNERASEIAFGGFLPGDN